MLAACVASGLALQPQPQPTSRRTVAYPRQLGHHSWASPAAALSSSLLPAQAAFAADDDWVTNLLASDEAKQVAVYAAQAAINWGVPAVVLVILVVLSGPDEIEEEKSADGLPPVLAKALGLSKEPREFLKIERLNTKLNSFNYSLEKATVSKDSALRRKQRQDLEQRLGAELVAAQLPAKSVAKIGKLEKAFRKADASLQRQQEAKVRKLRRMALSSDDGVRSLLSESAADARTDAAETDGANDTATVESSAASATVVEATEERSAAAIALDFVMQLFRPLTGGGLQGGGLQGGGDAEQPDAVPDAVAAAEGEANNATTAAVAHVAETETQASVSDDGFMGTIQRALEAGRLQDDAVKLQQKRLSLEAGFLADLSTEVGREHANALADIFRKDRVGGDGGGDGDGGTGGGVGGVGGSGALDVLGALRGAAGAAAAARPHVYVLTFFGDVTASQVGGLRQEVTAVLGAAQLHRGDEVVLVLNTGGGTVTGYGLAAAQLARIKDAGLKLTVCVEQVAASGGYMMACVADHLTAAPFAVIGSIGVVTEQPNVYERLRREGVEFATVTAGEYKRTLTPTKKIDKRDKAKLKEDIEQVLVLFKGFVARHRPVLDIDRVATGETWFGPDALALNLVDQLVTADDVLLDKVHSGAEVFSITYQEEEEGLGAGLNAGLLHGSGGGGGWRAVALALLTRLLAPGVDAAGGGTRKPSDEYLRHARQYSEPMLTRPDEAEPRLLWREDARARGTWRY